MYVSKNVIKINACALKRATYRISPGGGGGGVDPIKK